MKNMVIREPKNRSAMAGRQNDKTGLKLSKASYRCLRNERIAKYIMIVLSFGICLAAILNKFLPSFIQFPEAEEVQAVAATYINLVSGVILVVNIAVGFYSSRMHTEGTVLQDRYEAYVFDNPPNLAILRPISQTIINVYAQKVKKPDSAFTNSIFDAEETPDPDTAQFDYINRQAHSDYKLYISIQPFFITLWIGFCVLIIILAVTVDVSFVSTLINIMIPSLSAITTIGNSWHSMRLQMSQLQNLLTVIDQIQRLPDEKRKAYIKDKRNMRALADGLFNYRSSPFVIPNFLVRAHLKAMINDTVTIPVDDKRSPKTEMPTLILPDIENAVPEITEIIRERDIRTVSYSPTHTVDDINTSVNSRRYTGASTRKRAAGKPIAEQQKPAADKKPTAKPEPKAPAVKPEPKTPVARTQPTKKK